MESQVYLDCKEVVNYCNEILTKRDYKVTIDCVKSEIFVMNVYSIKPHKFTDFQRCIYDKLKEINQRNNRL
jgi:hypothetical protein